MDGETIEVLRGRKFLASLYLPDQNADACRAALERIQDGGEILLVTELNILETRNAICSAPFEAC